MPISLTHQMDQFGGVIIDHQTLPRSAFDFAESLSHLLLMAREAKKNLIWLTLERHHGELIPVALKQGFEFHNCHANEVTLICRLVELSFAPFAPTHTIGTGAIVINDKNELLVMRDTWSSYRGFKLPGGYLEQGERIESAVAREVLEETGIETRFDGVLGIRTRHPVQFGKSNMYIVCRLTPLSEQIVITDTDEVAEACWMPMGDFLQDPNIHSFNKQMVAELKDCVGLQPYQAKNSFAPQTLQEVFFAKG